MKFSGFGLYVAGQTGAFKGVKVDENGITVKNLQNIDVLKPSDEISVLRWDDENKSNILLGTVDQRVKVYDSEFRAYSTCIQTKCGSGRLAGVSRWNGAIVTCSESGHVKVWKYEESEQVEMHVGGHVTCMKALPSIPEIIATGGRQNDLKLWDLETKKKVFAAQNVPKDMLQLEVPIWVSDIQYLPDTEYRLVVSTKHGEVRLYDTKAQRRPVFDVKLSDQVLNTLTLCANYNQIVTGSATGDVLSVDIRGKGKVLYTYKGAIGSVRQVVADPYKPYLVSVGLDRYLRIHHLETRRLLNQEYLKVKLNAVLMTPNFMSAKTLEENDENLVNVNNSAESDIECISLEQSEDEFDDMFNKMETISEDKPTKARKRKLR